MTPCVSRAVALCRFPIPLPLGRFFVFCGAYVPVVSCVNGYELRMNFRFIHCVFAMCPVSLGVLLACWSSSAAFVLQSPNALPADAHVVVHTFRGCAIRVSCVVCRVCACVRVCVCVF